MANPIRGEVTVSIAGRAYTLRPSFHILCQLEERIGLSIPALLQRVAEKGLLTSEILMILALATRHDGSMAFDSAAVMGLPAESVDLPALMPALAVFLQHGLAAMDEGAGYGDLLVLAFSALRLEPAAFWQMTPPELRLLLQRTQQRPAPNVPQVDELAALQRRFPDSPAMMEEQHGG